MSGYIYCFSNESMEGIYKIGFTMRTPLMRLKEANRGDTWSLSGKFNIEFAKEVDDCREKERKIHKHLSLVGERVSDNRECFKISLEVVRSVFDLMDGRWYDISGDEKFTEIVQEIIKDDVTIVDNVDNKCEIESPDIVIDCDKAITCSVCSKIYKNLATYNQHLTYKRCRVKSSIVVCYNCKYCENKFSTKQNRQRHELKCTKNVIVTNNITVEQINKIIDCKLKSIKQ